MERTIIDPMEQMRDFDFVSFEHDVLVALGGLAADVTSGLANTVVGGLVASQTSTPSLSINIASGRIYQFAAADAIAVGSIAQDLGIICQQGYNASQTLTLTAPSSGQSQWSLVQAQFSQQDAVRANDPNGGLVPFYNAANPTQPTTNSINTVRKGLCVLQVVTGSAATTGSEVPPNPTSGWVPLYLIDLAGGQTAVTTSQILVAGPSVGTGVGGGYPSAPFLAGFLASHHAGTAGQAPKIKLTSEVQGVLPYVNMAPVRQLLNAPLTLYVNGTTGVDTNTGFTPSVPFKTIQAAVNSAYRVFDFNGNACTISVANGTYTFTTGVNQDGILLSGLPLGCPIVNLLGNSASPGSVTLSGPAGIAIQVGTGANCTINGFTIICSGSNQGLTSFSGYGLAVSVASYATIQNIIFGNCGSYQILVQLGGTVIFVGPVTFTGTTLVSVAVQNLGFSYNVANTVTVTGLTCSTAFVEVTNTATSQWAGNTFVGTASAPRYLVATNGVLTTNGGGANYFPGNSVGSVSTGGQYV